MDFESIICYKYSQIFYCIYYLGVIKITNKKQPYAQIFNGEKWLLKDKKQTIEDMSDKAFTIINKHYYGGNEYMNKFKSEYTDYNIDLNKRLLRDVELSILNSQESILVK